MNNTELKRCPFCGGEAETRAEWAHDEYTRFISVGVYCTNTKCKAKIQDIVNKDAEKGVKLNLVVQAWNRRPAINADGKWAKMGRLTKDRPLTEWEHMNLSVTNVYAKLKDYEVAEEQGRLSLYNDYAQTARLLTLEEVTSGEECWMEIINGGYGYCDCVYDPYQRGIVKVQRTNTHFDVGADWYNKTWRCWSSRPTEEQRKATPWPEEPPKRERFVIVIRRRNK